MGEALLCGGLCLRPLTRQQWQALGEEEVLGLGECRPAAGHSPAAQLSLGWKVICPEEASLRKVLAIAGRFIYLQVTFILCFP